MFDDFHAYFQENVVASFMHYRDVRELPVAGTSTDLRAATTAAAALYHFREHLRPLESMSRAQVAAKCPDYDLIGDINNAAKHAVITKGSPSISRAASLRESIVIVEYEDDQGTYTHSQKLVVAKLNDGTEREVFDIATNVINHWGAELVRLGVCDRYCPFPSPIDPGSVFVTRENARGLDLRIIRGVRFNPQFRMKRFDIEKGYAEPIDLTGSKITFNVYKPIVMDVKLTDDASGQTRKFSVELDRRQAEEFEKAQSEQEKRALLEKLLANHPKIVQQDGEP